MDISVIGMGAAVVERLLATGHRVTIYNRSAERSLPLTDKGARVAASAREAVEAFVAERATWVKDRNQMVGEARVELYPTELPEGVTERVISGTFVPVAAPADDD